MANSHFQKRIDALFSDIGRLESDPAAKALEIRSELETFRARLHALETEIAEEEKRVAEQTAQALSAKEPAVEEDPAPRRISLPVIYEQEQVGFAFSDNVVMPLSEPKIAPDSGIAVPLVAGGQPIGKVAVQPPAERALTPEEETLLTAVAQQASQQIENLRLLSATERARAEAEAATRRFIHENWDAFMDAIHHSERVGYAYDQASITPFLAPPQADGGVKEVIDVMDEHIGTLYLKPDPTHPLTNEDKAMVASIAKQVAQQVENIRLLADAARSRAEAEEASRRLTR